MAELIPNRVLCEQFRRLLTEGAVEAFANVDIPCSDLMNQSQQQAVMMDLTKSYRSALWKAFRELEDRLLPVDADMREKRKRNGEHG